MRSSIVITSVAALMVLASAGCGAKIHASTASNADLSRYRTYSFSRSSLPAQVPTSVDETIRTSLRQALASKGFTEATSGQPDFWIHYDVNVDPESRVFAEGTEYYALARGTLMVTFVDPQSNLPFWHGMASDLVKHPESPNAKKIEAVVGQLVDRYPSVAAAAPRTTM